MWGRRNRPLVIRVLARWIRKFLSGFCQRRFGSMPAQPTYDQWIDLVTSHIGTALGGTMAVGSAGEIPADYITRAITDHILGIHRIPAGIRATGYTVTGDLHLESLEFPIALFFERCHFLGNLHIWGMRSGIISFRGATIDGGVDLRGTDINGPLLLRDEFIAKGPVIARDMNIRGSIEVVGAALQYDGSTPNAFHQQAEGECFGFSRSSAAAMYWSNHRHKPKGKVNFRDAYVRSLIHDLDNQPPLGSWPDGGKLNLDGFRYDRIADCDEKRAIDWLGLQQNFSASSYSVLAKAFASMNQRQKSEDVLQQLKKREIAEIRSISRRYFLKFVYWLISFGQQPARALGIMAIALAVHIVTVACIDSLGGVHPSARELVFEPCYYAVKTCPKKPVNWIPVHTSVNTIRYVPPDYPKFSPIRYSLESFVPFVDFEQRAYWSVADDWLAGILAVVAAFGIFCAGLFATALTGLLNPKGSS